MGRGREVKLPPGLEGSATEEAMERTEWRMMWRGNPQTFSQEDQWHLKHKTLFWGALSLRGCPEWCSWPSKCPRRCKSGLASPFSWWKAYEECSWNGFFLWEPLLLLACCQCSWPQAIATAAQWLYGYSLKRKGYSLPWVIWLPYAWDPFNLCTRPI